MAVFTRTYPPTVFDAALAVPIALRGDKLMLTVADGKVSLPAPGSGFAGRVIGDPVVLGTLGDSQVAAAEIDPTAALPAPLAAMTLREAYGRLDDDEYALAGYAMQMVYWVKTSRFCPVCGSPTELRGGDWGRHCTRCGHVGYPRVSPATLILITKGDQILLAHKPGWEDRYSILAGFVEPGESLEECVVRETMEEVSIEIDRLTYFGSQPWPYPHQVMVGFFAEHAAGEIAVDGDELDDARWFTVDTLPGLPPPVSLSRRMIDAWIAGR